MASKADPLFWSLSGGEHRALVLRAQDTLKKMRAYRLIVLEYDNMEVKNKSDLSKCKSNIKEIGAMNSGFTSGGYVDVYTTGR